MDYDLVAWTYCGECNQTCRGMEDWSFGGICDIEDISIQWAITRDITATKGRTLERNSSIIPKLSVNVLILHQGIPLNR